MLAVRGWAPWPVSWMPTAAAPMAATASNGLEPQHPKAAPPPPPVEEEDAGGGGAGDKADGSAEPLPRGSGLVAAAAEASDLSETLSTRNNPAQTATDSNQSHSNPSNSTTSTSNSNSQTGNVTTAGLPSRSSTRVIATDLALLRPIHKKRPSTTTTTSLTTFHYAWPRATRRTQQMPKRPPGLPPAPDAPAPPVITSSLNLTALSDALESSLFDEPQNSPQEEEIVDADEMSSLSVGDLEDSVLLDMSASQQLPPTPAQQISQDAAVFAVTSEPPASALLIPPIRLRGHESEVEKRRRLRDLIDRVTVLFTPPSHNAQPPSTSTLVAKEDEPQNQNNQPMSISIITTTTMVTDNLSSSASSTAIISPPPPPVSLHLYERDFGPLALALNLPRHLGFALFRRVSSLLQSTSAREEDVMDDEAVDYVDLTGFERWIRATRPATNDPTSLSFSILASTSNAHTNAAGWAASITAHDLEFITADVLDTHPAFDFLQGSPAFQARFADTVIARLLGMTVRGISVGRIGIREWRAMDVVRLLHDVAASNNSLGPTMPSVFSYKDFYVIYCKFWDLDRDRDMRLTAGDLCSYARGAISRAAVGRVMELFATTDTPIDGDDILGHTTPSIGFREFVNFIVAVEDKTAPASLSYWFRVLDLDGDGFLSLLEVETFWEHQAGRVADQYTVEDFFSLILDLLRPAGSSVTLQHLRSSPAAAGLFLDMLIDSRRHAENVRRTSDGAFRLRDEVWDVVAVEGDYSAAVDDESGGGGGGMARRTQLEGWGKFSERCYRELTTPVASAGARTQQQQHQNQQQQIWVDDGDAEIEDAKARGAGYLDFDHDNDCEGSDGGDAEDEEGHEGDLMRVDAL